MGMPVRGKLAVSVHIRILTREQPGRRRLFRGWIVSNTEFAGSDGFDLVGRLRLHPGSQKRLRVTVTEPVQLHETTGIFLNGFQVWVLFYAPEQPLLRVPARVADDHALYAQS